jgi:hypothetical protein
MLKVFEDHGAVRRRETLTGNLLRVAAALGGSADETRIEFRNDELLLRRDSFPFAES